MPPHKTETTLRRGTACLSCRKRKLKCDGIRPVCRQCDKMNRRHTCEYDDKQQKSRTQLLKEQLSQLERRLHELESTSNSGSSSSGSPPSLTFDFDYKFNSFDDSAASKYPLFNLASTSTTPSPAPSESSTSRTMSFSSTTKGRAIDGTPESTPSSNLGSPPTSDLRVSLPSSSKKFLLDVFMQHKHQCWFYCSMNRFIETSQPENEPHPALVNAMYLLACHFSNDKTYRETELAFFVQTQQEINAALDNSDRLADIVQASSLLAIYLYMNNRIMEGYRHTFSAIRLAVGLGLHQLEPPTMNASLYPSQPPLISIAPPRDTTELNDRILAFWQVFTIDRCWSVANGLPLALPEKNTPQSRIITPWPSLTLNEPKWHANGFQPPLQSLFEGLDTSFAPDQTMPSLKAKAAALFELTSRSRNVSDPNDWGYSFAEAAVQRFSLMIPSQPSDRDFFLVQTMVYTSFIHLQRHVLLDGRAFKAGNAIVRLICQLGDTDWQYLDPIVPVCWLTAAEMFICAIAVATVDSFTGDVANVLASCNHGIDVILRAMNTFGTYSPLSADLAVKIELARC